MSVYSHCSMYIPTAVKEQKLQTREAGLIESCCVVIRADSDAMGNSESIRYCKALQL